MCVINILLFADFQSSSFDLDAMDLVNLREKAAARGYSVEELPGDGNHMLEAVVDQLLLHSKNGNYNARVVRDICVDFLRQHTKDPLNILRGDSEWNDYLAAMAVEKTNGDERLLYAIANAFQQIIEVVDSNSLSSTVIRPTSSSKHEVFTTLYLGKYGCEKYVSLHPTTGKVCYILKDNCILCSSYMHFECKWTAI